MAKTHQERITQLTQRRQWHIEQASAHQIEAVKYEGAINVLNQMIADEQDDKKIADDCIDGAEDRQTEEDDRPNEGIDQPDMPAQNPHAPVDLALNRSARRRVAKASR